jgi:hypothetical protein
MSAQQERFRPQVLPLGSGIGPPPRGQDQELDRIAEWWHKQSSAGDRIGRVIRQTFDEVLDAERTGRYDLAELADEERDYLAVRFRIDLRDEFNISTWPGGGATSLAIEGEPIAVRFEPAGGWRLPHEATGRICITTSASDDSAQFSFGVLRISRQADGVPGRLSETQLADVRWLWLDHPMPENVLKTLEPGDVQAIFAMSGKGNGQSRIDELFCRLQGRILPRRLIMTVAHQDDPMKRARTARENLQPRGILILGHQNDHPRICADFGLPVPKKGELIALRVIKATMPRQLGRTFVHIKGSDWVAAEPGEPDEPGPSDY